MLICHSARSNPNCVRIGDGIYHNRTDSIFNRNVDAVLRELILDYKKLPADLTDFDKP